MTGSVGRRRLRHAVLALAQEPQGAPVLEATVHVQGARGVTGPTGAAGSPGPMGFVGATGPMGTRGPGGTTGLIVTGAQGGTGAAGAVGVTGGLGAQGTIGEAGPDGVAGATGAARTVGAPTVVLRVRTQQTEDDRFSAHRFACDDGESLVGAGVDVVPGGWSLRSSFVTRVVHTDGAPVQHFAVTVDRTVDASPVGDVVARLACVQYSP